MAHVDQYGFRHQFGANESLLLHHLCQQLHEHYGAFKSDSQRMLSRWTQLLQVNTSSLQLPLTTKVGSNTYTEFPSFSHIGFFSTDVYLHQHSDGFW
jgi:hypothetical protein